MLFNFNSCFTFPQHMIILWLVFVVYGIKKLTLKLKQVFDWDQFGAQISLSNSITTNCDPFWLSSRTCKVVIAARLETLEQGGCKLPRLPKVFFFVFTVWKCCFSYIFLWYLFYIKLRFSFRIKQLIPVFTTILALSSNFYINIIYQ